MALTWVLETEVFEDKHQRLRSTLQLLQQKVVLWDDSWWEKDHWPKLGPGPILFHGSLENAAKIKQQKPWEPGAFCNVDAFRCAHWYPKWEPFLVHEHWQILSAKEFVQSPGNTLETIGDIDPFFVRPDSPLKPFSGRILTRKALSLSALDHGFYYEDSTIPIVVAPVKEIHEEWRFVVVDREVVAGSQYIADTRSGHKECSRGPAYEFACMLANTQEPPEDVYVLDVCQCREGLRVVELNPFSGANLYDCDRKAIAIALSRYVSGDASLQYAKDEPLEVGRMDR